MEQINNIEQYRDSTKRETLLHLLETSEQDTSGLVIKILEDEVEKALEEDRNRFLEYYRFLLEFCTEIVNRTKVNEGVKKLVSILSEIKHDEYLTIIDDYSPQEEDIRFSELIKHCGKDSKIVANLLKKFIDYGQSLFAKCCALETIGKYRICGLREKLVSYINQELERGFPYNNLYELGAAKRAIKQLDENNP